MTLYPEIVKNLIIYCENYKLKKIEIEKLQNIIYKASKDISANEDRCLSNFLNNMEGELELIRFTVDDEKIFVKSVEIVDKIIFKLKESLSSSIKS